MALLLIKGKEVRANTHVPLQEGRTLTLITEKLLPIPSFRPLATGPPGIHYIDVGLMLASVKGSIWRSIRQGLDRLGLPEKYASLLGRLLDDVTLTPSTRITPEFLKGMVHRSGLGWESKLLGAVVNQATGNANIQSLLGEDLKGLAAKLLGPLGQEGHLGKLVSVLNSVQLLNQMSLDRDGKIFLPIPMQSPDGTFTVAQVLLHLPRRGREERGDGDSDPGSSQSPPMKVSIQMTLSRLGPIRADVSLQSNVVGARFLLSTQRAKSLVESGIPSLVDRLRGAGFAASRISCHLTERSAIEEPLLTEVIQMEGGLSLVI